ncbi:hypothetical protein JL193_12330 [Polaribacter batillariae]|uniref:Uncharacterized protein n=1 Tax=Polaribacter batillariae TaxID=2808900 RepID=A0ABX7STW0_9FLAO|nr:hypothetical protein [Polaribacter batillariae]QTD36908.1 hypothetical protein JL193_12330 [Polaribacter batillariae]
MKNLIIFLGISFFFLTSCEIEEDPIQLQPIEKEWTQGSTMKLVPLDPNNIGFTYNIDQNIGTAFWSNTLAEFQAFLNITDKTINIKKIDIYAFVEEEIEGTYKLHGGKSGKLLTSIPSPSLKDPINFSVSSTDVFSLYATELAATHNGELLPEDLVGLRWTITATDGSVLDTRTNCFDFDCSYGIKTNIKFVDTWLGDFEYHWLEVGTDTERFSHADLVVGSRGTISFTPSTNNPEDYDVNDLSMGAAFEPEPGYLNYNVTTNTLTVLNYNTFFNSEWELVEVTDTVLTVKWSFVFSGFFRDFIGTVEIIRKDGLSWPEGLTIVNN